MKHKAQEALDNLIKVSCPQRTTCKECDIKDRCNSFGKDYINDIQKSIDNQLTMDEIKTLLHVYRRYSEERNVPFVSDSVIVRKLNKQREMWEVE